MAVIAVLAVAYTALAPAPAPPGGAAGATAAPGAFTATTASGQTVSVPEALAVADVAVVCTGAVGTVLGAAAVTAGGSRAEAPLVVCDLGLPRDVDPAVGELPGVTLIDLETIGDRLRSAAAGQAVEQTRAVVAEEVRSYLAAQRSAEVTPTVTALRRRAAEVVDAELLRLDGRLPELADGVRGEVAQTVRRVVDKLLHTPTVPVKRLAQGPGGDAYAEALRELFELDPQTPAALATPGPTALEAGVSVDPSQVDSALAADAAPGYPGGRR